MPISRTRLVAIATAILAPQLRAALPAPPVEQWRYVFAEHFPEPTPWADTNPIVVQLTDDDGDGLVTSADDPDVVFHAGVDRLSIRLVAVNGQDGSEIFQVVGPFARTSSVAQQGLLNIIQRINGRLGRPDLPDAARLALQRELSEASRLLDQTEVFLPR